VQNHILILFAFLATVSRGARTGARRDSSRDLKSSCVRFEDASAMTPNGRLRMHVRWAVAALSAITTIFGGVVAQAQSAAVSPQTTPSLPVGQVTGEALKKLVTGSLFSTISRYGRPITLAFYPDRHVVGTGTLSVAPYGPVYGKGSWNIVNNNQVCIDIQWGRATPLHLCRTITWDGKNFVESANGYVATFTPLH